MTTVQTETMLSEPLYDGFSSAPPRATGSFGLQHFLRVDLGIAVAILAVCCSAALAFVAIVWLKFSWPWGICFSFFTVLGVAWTVRMVYPVRDYPRRWVAFRLRRKLPADAKEWEPDSYPDPSGARQWTPAEGEEGYTVANDMPDCLRRKSGDQGNFSGKASVFNSMPALFFGLAIFASHYMNVLLAILVAFVAMAVIAGVCQSLLPKFERSRGNILMEALRTSPDPLCKAALAEMDKRFHERVAAKQVAREGEKLASKFAVVIPSKPIEEEGQPKVRIDALERPEVCANCGIATFAHGGEKVIMHTTVHDILGASHQTTELPTCYWCSDEAGYQRFVIELGGEHYDVITHVHPRFIDELVKLNPDKGCKKAAIVSEDSPPKLLIVS